MKAITTIFISLGTLFAVLGMILFRESLGIAVFFVIAGLFMLLSGIKLRKFKSFRELLDESSSHSRAIDIEDGDSERLGGKARKTLNSFHFMPIKMMYQKAQADEPSEYKLKIKEFYEYDGRFYLDGIKNGERKIKAFRVDRISEVRVKNRSISDPLLFFKTGEI